jgi:hypothetical protein
MIAMPSIIRHSILYIATLLAPSRLSGSPVNFTPPTGLMSGRFRSAAITFSF